MKKRGSQNGQALIEMTLMLAVLLGGIFFVSREFRSENFIARLVSGPWLSLAGMMQNGVWGAPSKTTTLHPNSFGRVTSPEGEAAQ